MCDLQVFLFVCLGFFLVCLWFLFCFAFSPNYVFVAVTGIYKVSVAYTHFRYLFLKTRAVYLVKTPKLWQMIRGNHKMWLVSSLLLAFCFHWSFSWSLAVFSKSSAHITVRCTGAGFVISLFPAPPSSKLMRVALCGSSAQWFAPINWTIISLLSLC